MVQSKLLASYTNLIHYFGDKNYTHDLKKLGINFDAIITTEQIHGNKVALIKNTVKKVIKGYDGMVTDKPILLGIQTADCMPIFFYDPKRKVIAAVHAGWKGLREGIIANTIRVLEKLGSNVTHIKVAVGPHIQICCYVVTKERVEKFDFLGERRLKSWYLDLGKIALFQLNSLGIASYNIEISDICTSCSENFWSFRRDGKKSGRMFNIISLAK